MLVIIDKFFALLRYAVQAADEVPQIEEAEWQKIFAIAESQTLLGVIFQGIQRCGQKPPQALIFQWLSYSERIKELNRKANQIATEVTLHYKEKGFRSCILKGQGNALGYPDPYSRTPGDVDIWIEGGRNKIMQVVNQEYPGQLERYHHVEIPPHEGIPIEVHFMPSYMRNPWHNRKLQKWFAEQSEEQFTNEVVLPEQKEAVCIPTPSFNCIYQLQHMFSHLFTEGFGLRQVIDYYFVLKSLAPHTSLPNDDYSDLTKVLKNLGLWKFAGAMMWIMKEVMCLEEKYMIAEPNEREGRFLLNEILLSGNMGHYDTRLGNKAGETVAHRYFRMTRRNMRFVRNYPSEALCEPIFRTWHFFWRLAH